MRLTADPGRYECANAHLGNEAAGAADIACETPLGAGTGLKFRIKVFNHPGVVASDTLDFPIQVWVCNLCVSSLSIAANRDGSRRLSDFIAYRLRNCSEGLPGSRQLPPYHSGQ